MMKFTGAIGAALAAVVAVPTVGQHGADEALESLNGALKRRLEQHLLIRGSRDFDTVETYEAWLHECIGIANRQRSKRLNEELSVMQRRPPSEV